MACKISDYVLRITEIMTTDTMTTDTNTMTKNFAKRFKTDSISPRLTPVKMVSSCVIAKILFQPKCFIRLRNAGDCCEMEGTFLKNLLYLLLS